MSSDSSSDFRPKDPLRALYLAYQAGEGIAAPAGLVSEAHAEDVAGAVVESLGRDELVRVLDHEMRSQSAWTLFFHSSVAERLKLNATDHKCLDMIWRCHETGEGGGCMTPGQLARDTKLTTGAVTGILDRLEQAGYVSREHDPDDRRRIIVRPVPERIKADVWPLFTWLSAEFANLCAQYTEEDLRRMIEFSREAQALLQRATEHLRGVGE